MYSKTERAASKSTMYIIHIKYVGMEFSQRVCVCVCWGEGKEKEERGCGICYPVYSAYNADRRQLKYNGCLPAFCDFLCLPSNRTGQLNVRASEAVRLLNQIGNAIRQEGRGGGWLELELRWVDWWSMPNINNNSINVIWVRQPSSSQSL